MTSAQATIQPADFDKIAVGDNARFVKKILAEDLEAFARLSGDYNPLHMDADFARRTSFQRRVVHGMLIGNYVSTLVGMHLPGPGALWAQQNFRWRAPVFIGDEISITLRVTHKSEGTRTINVEVAAVNQNGQTVLEGEGTVMLLEEKKQIRDLPLSERVALVTGSSRGIGAAIVRALAEAGCGVVINFVKNESAAADLQRAIEANGGQAVAIQTDVTDAEAVNRMVDRAARHFGRASARAGCQGADLFRA